MDFSSSFFGKSMLRKCRNKLLLPLFCFFRFGNTHCDCSDDDVNVYAVPATSIYLIKKIIRTSVNAAPPSFNFHLYRRTSIAITTDDASKMYTDLIQFHLISLLSPRVFRYFFFYPKKRRKIFFRF